MAAPVQQGTAWTGCATGPARVGPASSPPPPWPRSRRWPVSYPPSARPRWRSGAAQSWPARPSQRGLVVSVSASTVRRWLAKDAIKPWQHRSWIFPRDPNFATKAARVLDLYQRLFNGEPLARRRVRHQRRRETRRAGPPPHPRQPPRRTRPGHAGRARIHPRRHPGLPGRLRRAPRPGVSADANPPPASSRSPPWSTRS